MALAEYGSLQFDEQVRFFRGKVNLPSRRWADVWRDAHDTAFMVAGAYKAELLDDLRGAVDKAIAEGTTLAEFRRDFDATVARHGWSYRGSRGWRTRIIYETNLRTSYQAGRLAQMRAVSDSRPYWRYKHSDSVRYPRPQHLAWDGLVLRGDDAWWGAHYPPNGWGCKCRVFTLSQRELERMGKSGPDTAPDNGTREWVDKGTGEVHEVPNGIDPGWDYAPGASAVARVRRELGGRAGTLPRPLARALRRDLDAVPAAPAPPPDLDPAWNLPTFSTSRTFNDQVIADTLAALPGADEQLRLTRRFLDAHPQRAVLLSARQLGSGRAGREVRDGVAAFLGRRPNQNDYFHPRPSRVNGFTHASWDHVVVKIGSGMARRTIDPNAFGEGVRRAIRRYSDARAPQEWSVSAVVDAVAPGGNRPISTLVHELGHQVHFWAGDPARPAHLPSLTLYGTVNHREWHAEHFTAWLFDRAALAAWNADVARYFDELVETAARSTVKGG